LMLDTGQRRSDVHRMTWADVTGDTIRVVQQKTGAKLTIPLHTDLRAILAETKREHVTILNTEYGKPFTVDGFSGFFRNAIKAAGLPLDCQPHWLGKPPVDALLRPDARRANSWPCSATRRSPRPNATHAKPIRRGLQAPPWRNSKDVR
jgi:integrase